MAKNGCFAAAELVFPAYVLTSTYPLIKQEPSK
jgi:hypothetical protein